MIIGAQQLVTYFIIISIIIEKGYKLDMDKLSNILMFLEETDSLKVPLYFAIGGLQDTIILNTNYHTVNYDYSTIPNPINIVSEYEGKEKITLRELACLIIKAIYTNHRISDDKFNFSRKKDVLNNFKEQRAIQTQKSVLNLSDKFEDEYKMGSESNNVRRTS